MKSKSATLSGTITDANGTPIPNAVVSTQADKYPIPGARMAQTDKNGQYKIADLTPGMQKKRKHTIRRRKQAPWWQNVFSE